MTRTTTPYGYYHIRLYPFSGGALFTSNGERAYIVALLQDTLSPRLSLEQERPSQHISAAMDLLAFSLTKDEIHLLVFSIDGRACHRFALHIARCLNVYTNEFRTRHIVPRKAPFRIEMKRLRGVHQALQHSVKIHLRHADWEYDRYSSIGFYLHDRRGDWMRIWRLTNLYENNATQYQKLIEHHALSERRALSPPRE